MEEEEGSGGRGGTKGGGMQRVNLLRILFPNEQRSKSGRLKGGGGTQRVMRGVARGEGRAKKGRFHSPAIWIYCFRDWG